MTPPVHGAPLRVPGHGLVDHGRPLRFTFDGRSYEGRAGDTLASALLASGVKLVGRSFKYHRPRGVMTAGPEEPNALVELGVGARREPNAKATTVELYDGLVAASQNRWPSLTFDIGAVNSLLSPFFVAGFYYKTFKWPSAFWEKVYEPAIRRAAGLGRAAEEADPDRYEKAYAFCDVLVIGSGPAGVAAALAAGRSGARVILCEEDFRFGGRLLAETGGEIDGRPGLEWLEAALGELAAMPEVKLMPRAVVFGAYDGGTYGALEKVSDHLPQPQAGKPRQRLWRIVAKRTVLAAGAIERPLVFPGNDRPGVMLAGAVRAYANRFGVLAGRDAVFFANNDEAWRAAFDLAALGANVAAIVDSRREVAPQLLERARALGLRTMTGAVAAGTSGGRALTGVTVLDADGRSHHVHADLLAMSGGFNPQIALTTHLNHRPVWSEAHAAFLPGDLPPGMAVAGAAAGARGLGAALRSGHETGLAAARACGFSGAVGGAPQAADAPAAMTPLWRVTGPGGRRLKGKAFVDFQHDVTAADVELAHREGFRSVELLKRYTTLGMATDQGKLSNVNGHAILAGLLASPMEKVGTTTARAPSVPVAVGAFAGHARGAAFRPTRLVSGHEHAKARGATFVETGQWLRPQWYARPGETFWRDTVNREVTTTRTHVGVCDISTLGKIDVQGPDAAVFLDRVYINAFARLPVGKARYGVMLREDGFILDDGTALRLAEDHFVISTTTANAARVMKHLCYCAQKLWPQLDVQLASVTEAWAGYAVAGPKSRALLQDLLGDVIDLSGEAFPFMAVAEFEWAGAPVRLARISFSGELAYEISVPANYGEALSRALDAAGEKYGACSYGSEALGVMRIEKGHVGGPEMTGTTAHDVGLGRMMSPKKDFVGKALAYREGLTDPGRMQLVGLKPLDPAQQLPGGAHVLEPGAAPTTENDQGYVTSACWSPTLNTFIALALVKRGPQRIGEKLRVVDLLRGVDVAVEVCSPAFFDPDGSRQHG
ncbi:sarcosine oxidase subunit alpha family protein [Camelimonas abortus]|uniref:Sarcosine oxidase subunit alpha family protein n=1 Tax=Camelimonas abortus TaxID=1017184 RepID=A0ABV7LH22_9HYPH